MGFFAKDEIPEKLAVEKTTMEQILMHFEALENSALPTMFN